jgi:hypothetical protein
MKLLNIKQNYTTFTTLIIVYLRWPVTLLSWLVISPLGTIMLTLLYFNQRFKKEGYDMVLRLREIQKTDERKQLSGTITSNDTY